MVVQWRGGEGEKGRGGGLLPFGGGSKFLYKAANPKRDSLIAILVWSTGLPRIPIDLQKLFLLFGVLGLGVWDLGVWSFAGLGFKV